jgi:phosphoesterase RecJ-like protein
MGKNVRVLTVDDVPKKYKFLNPKQYLENFEGPHAPIEKSDLALIFDTNDRRLVAPLFDVLQEKCKEVLFVDHHPVLNRGPEPTAGSFVDTKAASTGEIAFFIIKELGVHLDANIARALYTSIVFDTQLFRYIRKSATSHLICAELLNYEHNPDEIHTYLFANHSADKIQFLAKVLSEIEFLSGGRAAILKVSAKDLVDNNLDMDDSRDVIDMIMDVQSVLVAALLREDEPGGYKLSLRSKGHIEILGIAESLDGGGHLYAAGAYVRGNYEEIKNNVARQLLHRLDSVNQPHKNGSE